MRCQKSRKDRRLLLPRARQAHRPHREFPSRHPFRHPSRLHERMIGRPFLALTLGGFRLLAQGRRAFFRRQRHHPTLAGPFLERAGEVVCDGAVAGFGEAEFDMAFLETHEAHIAFEGRFQHDLALLAGERHHILEAAKPHGRFGLRRLGARLRMRLRRRQRHGAGCCRTTGRPGRRGSRTACRQRRTVLQRAQGLVRRRQIGGIGKTHQHHFSSRNRPVGRLNLGDALQQHLPGA